MNRKPRYCQLIQELLAVGSTMPAAILAPVMHFAQAPFTSPLTQALLMSQLGVDSNHATGISARGVHTGSGLSSIMLKTRRNIAELKTSTVTARIR